MRVVFILLTLLVTSFQCDAQTWRVYSPDKRFSVELPALLQLVTFFEGKHGASNEPGLDADKDVVFYAALQPEPKDREYGVIVIDGGSKKMRPAERQKRVEGLDFVIGGDDATPTSERALRVNGLLGKEYIYANDIADEVYTRGRIFDVGDRIYVIVFRARTAADLKSADAERFLNSFRSLR